MKVVAVAAVLLLAAACAEPPAKPAPKEIMLWQELGSWSGRGNIQTETFLGLTGALRFHWKTKNEALENAGTFRLILASAVSGRDLLTAVDEKGVGEGTAYAAEDPRPFHVVVESANLDWSFTVEEGSLGAQPE